MSDDPVDVLIIGAGAAGAAVAWSLVETRMKIVCLEQGGFMNPMTYPSTGRDWEARTSGDFSISPNTRQLEADYPVNDDASPIKVANFNAVGGSTILYAGQFPRFHPSDFRVRSLDGVADDWPIDFATLEPYYALNDRVMGVAGLQGDPANPPRDSISMPPLPLGKAGQAVVRGLNQLGWHWWPSDVAIATERFDGRERCINLGTCVSGCAQGAKASTDITYWPQAMRGGVELRPHCRVREITVNDDGMATGVIYVNADGQEQALQAHVVIVACNGIGTPRLLLNSKSARFPDGLANSSGLVGKNLMFHPYAAVQGVFDEPLDGYQGPHKGIQSQEFYETDKSRGFVRGYTFEYSRGMGPVATGLTGLAQGRVPWGADHHTSYRKLFKRVTSLVALCEDLPEEHNRVSLDPDLTDSDGIPAPRIEYKLSENSMKMLDHAVARGTEALQCAGATDTFSLSPIGFSGWHLMGTARMGRDPRRSVVNEWGRSHDVKNLFIVDGSIFVTSAAVNPTSTIQALALYVGDQIKNRLANLFD